MTSALERMILRSRSGLAGIEPLFRARYAPEITEWMGRMEELAVESPRSIAESEERKEPQSPLRRPVRAAPAGAEPNAFSATDPPLRTTTDLTAISETMPSLRSDITEDSRVRRPQQETTWTTAPIPQFQESLTRSADLIEAKSDAAAHGASAISFRAVVQHAGKMTADAREPAAPAASAEIRAAPAPRAHGTTLSPPTEIPAASVTRAPGPAPQPVTEAPSPTRSFLDQKSMCRSAISRSALPKFPRPSADQRFIRV